jgi:hypothetical protein
MPERLAMNKKRITSADIETLVGWYARAAEAYGATNDPRAGNRQHDIIAAIYHELRGRGGDAQRALLKLRSHPSGSVRGWVGAHALEFSPDDGVEILEEVAKGPTEPPAFAGFDAEMTLREWRLGRLRFP